MMNNVKLAVIPKQEVPCSISTIFAGLIPPTLQWFWGLKSIRTMTSLTSLYATAAEKPKYHLSLKSEGDCPFSIASAPVWCVVNCNYISAQFNLPWQFLPTNIKYRPRNPLWGPTEGIGCSGMRQPKQPAWSGELDSHLVVIHSWRTLAEMQCRSPRATNNWNLQLSHHKVITGRSTWSLTSVATLVSLHTGQNPGTLMNLTCNGY